MKPIKVLEGGRGIYEFSDYSVRTKKRVSLKRVHGVIPINGVLGKYDEVFLALNALRLAATELGNSIAEEINKDFGCKAITSVFGGYTLLNAKLPPRPQAFIMFNVLPKYFKQTWNKLSDIGDLLVPGGWVDFLIDKDTFPYKTENLTKNRKRGGL